VTSEGIFWTDTVGPLKSSYGVWGSALSSPSGIWGGAPAKIEFGAF